MFWHPVSFFLDSTLQWFILQKISLWNKKNQILTLCFLLYRLNSSEGWLADAVGNYTVDSKCTWLIEAPSADSNIRLHLKEFATECGWDHLYIFDGDSVFSDVAGVLSGTVFPHIRPAGIIISNNPHMGVLLENTTFLLHKNVRIAGIIRVADIIRGRALYEEIQ